MAQPISFLEPLKTLHENRSSDVFGEFIILASTSDLCSHNHSSGVRRGDTCKIDKQGTEVGERMQLTPVDHHQAD